ncbi:MAG: hypothetical protein P4M09_17090 [Devosia sp.]|nr:hypothetical protein [Devosia sp.]
MSATFAELYGTEPTIEPITSDDVRTALKVALSDDDLAILIHCARIELETDTGLHIARQQWNVPRDQLGSHLPHEIIGQSRGGVDIAVGFTALPKPLKGALLVLIGWMIASRGTGAPYAEAMPRPTFTHLRNLRKAA